MPYTTKSDLGSLLSNAVRLRFILFRRSRSEFRCRGSLVRNGFVTPRSVMDDADAVPAGIKVSDFHLLLKEHYPVQTSVLSFD